MTLYSNEEKMRQLAEKLGVPLFEHTGKIKFPKLHDVRIVDLLPDMMVMIRSLVTEEEFVYRRNPITAMEKGLLVSFQNVFNDGHEDERGLVNKFMQEPPHVRMMPSHVEGEVRFPKQAHIKQITILIEMDYLKRFFGTGQDKFSYLFNVDTTFWIEEFISPEMAGLIDEVVNAKPTIVLPDVFYRLKALELLYLLAKNLSDRKSIAQQHLSATEMDAVYKVRNAIAASLDKPLPVRELVQLGGMNELKLRKLFTEVFGKGLYSYFQHIRMQEAARLLKETKLSVAETGYQLGFSNLSHFGRLFEEHMGMKPKKWSSK